MRYRFRFGFALALGLALMAGCSDENGEGGTGGTEGGVYASKDLWLCRPDIPDDYCDDADLTVTVIEPDGTKVVDDVPNNTEAPVDCFFVYPTVNSSQTPGNTEALVPPPPGAVEAVQRIVARYRGVCRIFAPLYHQMSISTYFEYVWSWQDTPIFQRAYDDIAEAFDYYMGHFNQGRDFVLIGHSQGSHILAKFLKDALDDDEELRGHLLSAILMGHGATVQVLPGEVVGGTYENIPICASSTSTGCVIAFDAIAAGVDFDVEIPVLVSRPNVSACVNPASFDETKATLAALEYPRFPWPDTSRVMPFPGDVETEWVRYPNIYTSQCRGSDSIWDQLVIDLADAYEGEVPITPQDLQNAAFEDFGYHWRNLHIMEPFLMTRDLVRIVQQQSATRSD